MKFTHIGIVFLVGMLFFIPGAICTYFQWPLSSELLITGSVLKVAVAGMFAGKWIAKKNKENI